MSFGAPDPELYGLADQYDGVAGPAPANAAPAPMPAPEVQPVDTGGLGNFDVDAASQNLAAVGQQPPAPAPGDVPPAAAPVVPGPPPVDPLSVAPPAPPPITGDPEKDLAANLQYQRDLSDHYGKREQELTKRATSANAEKAAKEVEIAKEYQRQHDALRTRQAAERAAAQRQIDDAVTGRAAAQKDLEGANWADQHTGRAIVATIFGAIGAGLQNAAAAHLGQVGHAENEGAKAVDRMIQRDYDIKKQRIASMSESLLEARHGYQDLAENQRAAMNDLDADTSVKYKLVAKEAEARLRQAGASEDDIKRNAFVANAKAQAAKAEAQILDREQTHRDTREGHEATRALADAHLNLQERQIDATIADRRSGASERRREFEERQAERREARAEKAAAAAEKKTEKEDTTAVRAGKNDPSGRKPGEIIGHVPTGRGGAQGFATRDADYARAEDQLQAFLDHVEKYGERALSPQQIKERESLYNNALGGVVTVSPMGKTNEAQEVERHSIGASGGISLMGANAAAVRRKIAELRKQREEYREQILIPVEGSARTAEKKTAAPGGGKGDKYGFLDDLLDEKAP
jgi:hypothetical protein